MKLIRFEEPTGFILRAGRFGVAFFGDEWRLCLGWRYVSDLRGPNKVAQRRWINIWLWPPRIGIGRWVPI